MEILLISGAHSVGKTTALYHLTKKLIGAGYEVAEGKFPEEQKDFLVVLEGRGKRIIINSACDDTASVKTLKAFYDDKCSNEECDILISAIRDDGFYPREDFFNIMGISKDTVSLEIPLARVARRQGNKRKAVVSYSNSILLLIMHCLNAEPFCIEC